MPEGRPEIPMGIQREVLVEAGHRCAIPTCRQHPVQLAHIDDWAKVRKHEAHNIIALCGTCHQRVTAKQIDRLSLLQYKANLSLLNSRYGSVERRVLEAFTDNPDGEWVDLPHGFEVLMSQALTDGLFVARPSPKSVIQVNNYTDTVRYIITPNGREFVRRWREARPIE